MIKRYILHLEFHWGYRPIISFRRAPYYGQRVVDGGVPGTLVRCEECGDGYLHQPDSFAGLWPERAKPLQSNPEVHHWYSGRCRECEADGSWCDNPHVEMEPVIDERCTTCGGTFDYPYCSRNPLTGEGGHTYGGGVTSQKTQGP